MPRIERLAIVLLAGAGTALAQEVPAEKLGTEWTQTGDGKYESLAVTFWRNDGLNRDEVWHESEAGEAFLKVADDVFVLARANDDGEWFTLPKTLLVLRLGNWQRLERESELVPFKDLVGHWKLDEKEGAEARDSSGYGKTGTHAGGAKPHADSRSLAFDGKAAHVKVGDHPVLTMKKGFAFAAWVYPTGTAEAGGILANKEGEYEIGRSGSGKLQFALANDSPGWNWVETEADLPLNKWTHVAWSYSAKDKRIKAYANGKVVYNDAGEGDVGDAYPDQNELWIGARQKEGGAEFFEGRIADVRVYDRALTDEEVKAVRAADATGRE